MDSFLAIVNPSTQSHFAMRKVKAFMGDYPTLADICNAYGKTFAEQWLYPQLTDLSTFTGARNMTPEMIEKLAAVIAAEYRYLKVTELLVFFHLFKTGKYGRFYGSVDPMVITCALRDFLKDRSVFIEEYERFQNNIKLEEEKRKPTMSYEEYLKLKEQENES